MVMTDFSLPNRSTTWEGEVANSSIIYDFVRRGERPIVTLEDLSGLESENATKWMSLLQECWQLLEKQSSQSLQEKKNYLRRALISLELASKGFFI